METKYGYTCIIVHSDAHIHTLVSFNVYMALFTGSSELNGLRHQNV